MTGDVVVQVINGVEPTIEPVADKSILWPPNHKWVSISIVANAVDNSGLPVTLTAVVTSNEPVDGLGRGDKAPDWTEPIIDQENGVIHLDLRAERSGRGNGREYSVTIIAEDVFGNSSVAIVKIIVPHDKGGRAEIR